jgi:uncharacterized protein (TIGR02646 family)
MLRVPDRPVLATTVGVLKSLQHSITLLPDYSDRVNAAIAAWNSKTSSKAKSEAFQDIRKTLALMCVGPIRCAYCEDSLADEIEHIKPKSFFPEFTFSWSNYLYSCGPCNGPKGNRYGAVNGGRVEEFVRKKGDPLVPPPAGPSALVDPRADDPLDFLDLDLGGVAPDGALFAGTFLILPREGSHPELQARAEFTIEVLGLNREVIRAARANAFGGFRARLREYVSEKLGGASPDRLEALKADILGTPHLTVFAEMRRQKNFLPMIRSLFDDAPETEGWPLVP